MPQENLERSYFRPQEEITSLINDDRQTLAFTGYYQVGDIVDVIDVGPNGCRISILGTATIVAIEKDQALIFDSAIDTSAATGTPYAFVRDIDDGQEAIDRLYRLVQGEKTCEILEPVLAQQLDTPIVGQGTYSVADVGYFRAGDNVIILADEGYVGEADVVSADPNGDEANNRATIVLDDSIDTSAFTNPKFQLNLPVCTAIDRLKQDIDAIDEPIENEDLDTPDCSMVAFETDNLFRQGSSKVFLDGQRLRLGTAGSRASLTQGAGDSQLTYTSMILGTPGNSTQVSVSAGAGIVVSVTGNFESGYSIDVTDNGGAATSAEIAAAINADADARRIVQVQYGGAGTGVVATFASTNLTGGANDGTGDYAELPIINDNQITNTGYKWISLWILPDDRNRLNKPPRNSEEMYIDYRKLLYNA